METIPICTLVGGIKNMIEDSINGILSTGVSQHEIEDSLTQFIDMPNEEKKMIKLNSLASFSKYDMTTCSYKYEALIFSLR